MALPQQLKSARMTDATIANTIDNEVGNAEKAIADIFGIPIDTAINSQALPWRVVSNALYVPMCRATSGGAMGFLTGAWTDVILESEDFDNDAIHDTAANKNRFVMNTAGKYAVTAIVTFAAISALGSRRLRLVVNSSPYSKAVAHQGTASFAQALHISALVHAGAPGDWVGVQGFQDSGVSIDMNDAEFTIFKVGG